MAPSQQASQAGHETQDVSPRTILRLMALLAGVALLVVCGMLGLARLFAARQAAALPPLTVQQLTRLPVPGPNLQNDPPADITRLHAAEDRLLDSYAWTDAARTRARIPLSAAEALVIGKSLETAP